MLENLRQLCVFKVATAVKRPWVWWDYVTDFQIRCPMKDNLYNQECAEKVITSLCKHPCLVGHLNARHVSFRMKFKVTTMKECPYRKPVNMWSKAGMVILF